MQVNAYVHVRSEDGVKSAVLAPGDTVPDWAVVNNKAVLVDEPDAEEAPAKTDEDAAPKRTRRPAAGK